MLVSFDRKNWVRGDFGLAGNFGADSDVVARLEQGRGSWRSTGLLGVREDE